MKKDISEYVAKCLTCQQVKAEHQVPSGLLNPLPIPQWKWDNITMDFVSGFPLTQKKHDAIWVIVDRLTKSAHFLPIRLDYSMDRLADLYVNVLKIKPTSPHACACFSPYLTFLFSFFNFPELMQCTVIIIIDLESF